MTDKETSREFLRKLYELISFIQAMDATSYIVQKLPSASEEDVALVEKVLDIVKGKNAELRKSLQKEEPAPATTEVPTPITVEMPYGKVELFSPEDATRFVLHMCSECPKYHMDCSGARSKRCEKQKQEVIRHFKKEAV